MGLPQLISDIYAKTLGGTNPPGAASSTGDIGQILKYLAANGAIAAKTLPIITPFSPEATGVAIAAAAPGALASSTAFGANQAIYVPFVLEATFNCKKIFWHNGGTAAGNIDAGVYNEAGAKLGSTGATAQGTINVLQEVNVADFDIPAGLNYLAMSVSSASATFFCNSAMSSITGKAIGLAVEAAAHPLPANFTLATYNLVRLPMFGISSRVLAA